MRLRPIGRGESERLLAGRREPVDGLRWHRQYPTDDTIIALSLLKQAYAALALRVPPGPVWWLHQIVDGFEVVGDIGFHGPPVGSPVRVEIGYCVVPARRGRGIATRACALLLDRAWAAGADEITAVAAADNPASRAVLRSAGFTLVDGDRFTVARPGHEAVEPRVVS